LRSGTQLSREDADALTSDTATAEQQCAALAGLALRAELTHSETAARERLSRGHPEVAALFGSIGCSRMPDQAETSAAVPGHWQAAADRLFARQAIGDDLWRPIVADVVSNSASDRIAAALLMAICINGLSVSDIRALTSHMVSSGDIFDYRCYEGLRDGRLVRRYPTGAMSEKTALILPALIALARARVNVYSPFLVARSLGHTGGTWDKLNAIPGFRFPDPGEDTARVLRQCGAAMVVTHGAANPADRRLYQLRSVTGTVESIPLIAASIASKQMSFPAHRLLLDVRIGEGAFLRTEDEGTEVAELVRQLVKPGGTECMYTLTGTKQPTGSAIGNALEVAEAIAVMGGPTAMWDERGLLEQRLLVIDFFAKLMAAEFRDFTVESWARYGSNKFVSGEVLQSFARILAAHSVSSEVVSSLLMDPLSALGLTRSPVILPCPRAGYLRRVDQVALGGAVNFALAAGGNEFGAAFDARTGVVLQFRIGDSVDCGDPLCSLYSTETVAEEIVQAIVGCFEIS
jgi:thymidine phosphorylase